MGSWGPGPFDNDHASDLIGRLLDGAPAAGVLRQALGSVQRSGFLDIDEVAGARAACSLVGIVVTGAAGIDVESEVYEAASCIRPTTALVRQSLAALPALLDERSELRGLLDASGRATVEAELVRLTAILEQSLDSRTKPKPLPRPKVLTVKAYAVPVGQPSQWMAFVLERNGGIAVFDRAWQAPPAPGDLARREVLFRCVLAGNRSVWSPLVDLGRIPIDAPLARPWAAVGVVDTGCTGSPTPADFRTYHLERDDRKVELVDHATAARLPWYRSLERDELTAALEQHLATGSIEMLRVPSPDERRMRHLARCLQEPYWRHALDTGSGGGPFDFTAVVREDPTPYVRHWIARWLVPGGTSEISVPGDLTRWMLVGLVAAVAAPASSPAPRSTSSLLAGRCRAT